MVENCCYYYYLTPVTHTCSCSFICVLVCPKPRLIPWPNQSRQRSEIWYTLTGCFLKNFGVTFHGITQKSLTTHQLSLEHRYIPNFSCPKVEMWSVNYCARSNSWLYLSKSTWVSSRSRIFLFSRVYVCMYSFVSRLLAKRNTIKTLNLVHTLI